MCGRAPFASPVSQREITARRPRAPAGVRGCAGSDARAGRVLCSCERPPPMLERARFADIAQLVEQLIRNQ